MSEWFHSTSSSWHTKWLAKCHLHITALAMAFAACCVIPQWWFEHSALLFPILWLSWLFALQIFQIPSQFIATSVNLAKWLAFLLIAWGIVATSFVGLTSSHVHLYILRFLLGKLPLIPSESAAASEFVCPANFVCRGAIPFAREVSFVTPWSYHLLNVWKRCILRTLEVTTRFSSCQRLIIVWGSGCNAAGVTEAGTFPGTHSLPTSQQRLKRKGV